MTEKPRRTLRTIAGLIVSRGFVAVAGFVASVLWARSFDQDTYGKYQYVMAGLQIAGTFCLLGLNDSALISSAKKKDGNLGPILRLRLIASVIGGLVIAAWGLVRYLGSDTPMMLAFVISGLLFIPAQLQPIWTAFANGKRRFRLLTVGQIVVAATSVIGIAVFAIIGATTPDMLPWAMLLTQGLATIVGLYLLTTLRALKETDERDASIITYGHHVTVALLLSWVFSSDRLIVGEVLSNADVALLSIALVLPNQVKIFFATFEQFFLPDVTEAPTVAAAWIYIKPRIARLWAAYALLGVIGFFALPVFIPIFFSHKYVEAVPYAKWIWLSLCVSSAFSFFASILNSQRDKRFLYIKNIANPLITLALFALLIPRYGLTGAVVARIINHVLVMVLHIVYFMIAIRRSERSEPS